MKEFMSRKKIAGISENVTLIEECSAISCRRRNTPQIDETLGQKMIYAFCRPRDEWVIVCGLGLRLNTTQFLPIPIA